MSDSPTEPTEHGERGLSLFDRISIFLTEESPVRLMIWGAFGLVLAGVCTYIGLRLQNGLSFDQVQRMLDGGNVTIPHSIEDQNTAIQSIFGLAFGVLAFVFGIAGGLLPMWSVGRLIADAIHAGENE